MKAIILAAGYATRLRPLTDHVPKPLLTIGERPMLDWIHDKIQSVSDVDAIYVVTNDRYADAFERWASQAQARAPIVVHNDRTTSNDDRLGAVGDIQFTIDEAGLMSDDLLVIAGDNLFDFDLTDYVQFWHSKGFASCIALYRCGRELAHLYGNVALDGDDRVIGFVEKPSNPASDLASTATYIYHRSHVPLIRRYLAEGNSPDQPGNFIAWLYAREPVYGFSFEGYWLDIGDREQLLEADNLMRRRIGLPVRATYDIAVTNGRGAAGGAATIS